MLNGFIVFKTTTQNYQWNDELFWRLLLFAISMEIFNQKK